jgi:hypothetical protein
VPSTVIRSFGYDPQRRELKVEFRSGRIYVYLDVPPETFAAMTAAFAKGPFFNTEIRDRFRFVRLGT